MAGPYPLSTLAPTISATGIAAPAFTDILASQQASFAGIFGTDAVVTPDSQDGQLLSILSSAIHDTNDAIIAAFQAFSPTFAQGIGLSSLVKINGMRRQSPSFSTAVGNVVGVTGSVIVAGTVVDQNGNTWDLPGQVTIPISGSISVTVTSAQPGALTAPAGTINLIGTPTLGWQSFVSTTDAVPGLPVETDSALRQRQTTSTSLSAKTPLASVLGALENVAGVGRVAVYENTTGSTDSNGLTGHSISAVVEGGDVLTIAMVIGQTKTPGAATFGTTSQAYVDPITGLSYTINFYELATSEIKVNLTIHPLNGYSSAVLTEIQNAVAAYINSLVIAAPVQFSRIYAPAYLNGLPDGLSYEINALTIAIGNNTAGTSDLVIAFNKAATCNPSTDVTIVVS